MKKAYLLVYNDQFGTRDQVKAWLNEMPEVTYWRYDMPHSFYLISETEGSKIGAALHERSGDGRFIVTEIGANKGGWLPKDTWYLVDNKEHKAPNKPE